MDSLKNFWYNGEMYLNLKTHKPERVVAALLVAVIAVFAWGFNVSEKAIGGEPIHTDDTRALEDRLYDLRTEQTVRARRSDILRSQLHTLEAALESGDGSDETLDEYRAIRDDLLALLLDGRKAEEEIAASLHELWDAQGIALRLSRDRRDGDDAPIFDWPVEPELGISAHFDDPGYRARFGFSHKAIDIPVNQESIVRAAADGVVKKVSDQGYGFNSLVILHKGGIVTLYGHVTEFLVEEGDEVEIGDAIARSGGMPGTKGSGKFTTGSHLHLEFIEEGKHVDPQKYLPKR